MKNPIKKLMATLAIPMVVSTFFLSCNTEDIDTNTPFIGVAQTVIDVSGSGGEVTLAITSNRPWTLTDNIAGDKWLITDKTSGNGDATITLTIAPNTGITREADLRIATQTVYADVRITQTGDIASEVLYADDFGNGVAAAPWPSVADYTGWNKTGTGAANVTYAEEGGAASVRNNSNSTGYDGASGQCNVMMAAAGASFLVNGIELSGMTGMTLSFGANETNSILHLFYNTDGSAWTEVSYAKTNTDWGLVTVTFDVPAGSSLLNLKFTAGATQYGTRIDDIKLVGAGGAPAGDLSVSPASLNFAAAGETKSFSITSTKAWTVTSSENWCTVGTASGNGSATINVTAAANTGAQRSATITVATDNPADTRTVTVTQAAAGSGNDGSHEHPYSVSEAMSSQGAASNTNYKWVKGYIVGVVETGSSNTANFAGPFTNQTNLLLAATGGETEWDNCLNVQLPTEANAPGVRAALNLVNNASNVGKEVLLEGTLEAYFLKPGLKNTRAYEWVSATGSNLTVSSPTASFTAASGTQEITVTSNTSWTITEDAAATWCSVTPLLTGSNNGTFTINTVANTGTARSATITVKTDDNAVTRTVAVTQAGVSGGSTDLVKISLAGLSTSSALTTLYVDGDGGSRVERVLAGGETMSNLSYTSSSSSIWTGGWNNAGAAWLLTSITATAEIYGTITVSFNAFGVNASPRNWLMEYSNDNTTWHSGATYAITSAATPGDAISETITIPEADKVSAGGKLYIRLMPDPSSTTSVNGSAIGTSNVNSRLASSISVVKN